MRRVACFVAQSALGPLESASAALDELVQVTAKWLIEKGLPAWIEGTTDFLQRDGRLALVSAQRVTAGSAVEWEVTLDEPHDGRRFFSRLCLGVRDKELHLFLEMRAGADGYLIAPVNFQVHTPRVWRDLLSARGWFVGNTPVSVKPIPWTGMEAGRKFLAVVHHADRNLPIVAVSRYQGQWLTPTLGEDLARDLAGLAIVADLDEVAGWAITNEAGKVWSCYGAAVRVYWPFRGGVVDPRAHPLWTAERLTDSTGSSSEAGRRIRDQLRRHFHELSTYAVDEPPALFAIRSEASRGRLEELRKEAAESDSYEQLSEQLSERCVQLETALAHEREQNLDLRAKNESLQQVWNFTSPTQEDEIAPSEVRPVTSIEEAVKRAEENLADDLVFGIDVRAALDSLAYDAGPPDKVYSYFERLAEMNQARRGGPLGKDVIVWLRERGVSCSNESETVLNSASEMGRRTWHDGRTRRKFEQHLKPSDGTSPDRCVRIYFAYDDGLKKTVVGYVGRHPGT